MSYKHSEAKRRSWRIARRISEVLQIPLLTAWRNLKNLSEIQKNIIDHTRNWPKIPSETLTELKTIIKMPQEPVRRPSKGNKTLPVRAGAPNEYLKTPSETIRISLKGLKNLKEICLNHFENNWDLLVTTAKTMKDLLEP